MIEDKKKINSYLVFIVLALSTIGVVIVYSSTAFLPISRSGDSVLINRDFQFIYLKKHLISLAIAIFFMGVFYWKKTVAMKRYAYPLLIISFILLLCIFIPGLGVKVNGARRWLRLWPLTFQPSELAKLAMVFYLAHYLSSPKYRKESFIEFLRPVSIMFIFQGMMLLQPDLGTSFTLGLITFSMLYISGAPLRYIFFTVLAALPVLVKFLMEPFRRERLLAFLNPWGDQYGSGFQLIQSFIAFGSGGLSGVGLGNSEQKLSFLPEINTDFIFSFIGEELGFIGVTLVLVLFVSLFVCGVSIAIKAQSPFSYYLAFGLTLMITFQVLINIAVVTGLLPTKGLTLPFVSYGGSSLLVNFMAAGTLLRISRVESEQYRLSDNEMLLHKRKRFNRQRRIVL